jgi:3'-5' exoribonuclease
MPGKSSAPVRKKLSELNDGDEADFFALLTRKEELTTRTGDRYIRVAFRDAQREVNFPLFKDSPWIDDCRDRWVVGEFYKLRALYRETSYGPQLEIRKIRPVVPQDAEEGFDLGDFVPSSRFPPEPMFAELVALAEQHIEDEPLRRLVLHILQGNRDRLLTMYAARRNHHAYRSGFLEHVLSVARTCVYLAEKYREYYPDMQPPLSKSLVVAGGILHDIGKLRELEDIPSGAQYTPEGELIGHILQGRDIVREAAAECPVDADTLLRLEHIIVAHQRLPEWGSPKPPMTPEALLVHYADDVDAKFNMVYAILRDEPGDAPITSNRNILGHKLYRGGS